MSKDIRLYIMDKLVDFGDKILIPINYQQEDYQNPTVIKIN